MDRALDIWHIDPDPVRQWVNEQSAEARAKALLLANTGEYERAAVTDDGQACLHLRGELSNALYKILPHPFYSKGPCRVYLLTDAGDIAASFCIYTERYSLHPSCDEALAMAFYIKYAERSFLGEAVPRPYSRAMWEMYKTTCAKAGARNEYVLSAYQF